MKQLWVILSVLAATCCMQASPMTDACPCGAEDELSTQSQDCSECCDSKPIADCSCCISQTEAPETTSALSPWRVQNFDTPAREIVRHVFAHPPPLAAVHKLPAPHASERSPHSRLRLALQQSLLL
ncbi:hypothetical protein IEN85_00585 [Pelagicoccus sp. NFK12]|uniref:Uncharacterized protein n=1 Tax=Pelagicoccus enzymogenes TaxID=2773457 RepID=A0A927IFN9_9BACT|nr:hypothetical protein [Pelagicoccus enzymogenes]MBD5777989.1 hypothetical protein [Pelagicoccus enzymogenes]